MTLEKRALSTPVEVRKVDSKRTVTGYAALFGSEARIAHRARALVRRKLSALRQDMPSTSRAVARCACAGGAPFHRRRGTMRRRQPTT